MNDEQALVERLAKAIGEYADDSGYYIGKPEHFARHLLAAVPAAQLVEPDECAVKHCEAEATLGMTVVLWGQRVEIYACEPHFDALAADGLSEDPGEWIGLCEFSDVEGHEWGPEFVKQFEDGTTGEVTGSERRRKCRVCGLTQVRLEDVQDA